MRGRKGGFRLARPADQIIMGDLFRVTEGPLNLVECFDPETNSCPMIGACRFSHALSEATKAFLAVLDDLTLADMVANRDELIARMEPRHEEIFDLSEV
jgi:Rrf2 family nitric oxide-sensitive transcriptional repressor